MSLSKASRMLAQAREVFGDPLFHRFGRGLTPTDRVHAIVEHARKILIEMRLLFDEPTFNPEEFNRVLRIACLDNAFPIMIEPVFEHLMFQAPHCAAEFITYDEQTFSKMRAGEIDFGLFPPFDLPSDFDYFPLIKTPYVNVVRVGHPLEKLLAETNNISTETLNSYRRIQILVRPDKDTVEGGVPGTATVPIKANNVMLWTSSWLAAVRMLHKTDAILTIPWRTATVLAEDRPLVVLGREMSVLWLEPALIWHRKTNYQPLIQWIRSLFAVYVRRGNTVIPDQIKLGRLG